MSDLRTNMFLVSGSIDNIVDHFATCRFGQGSLTAITFQNVTTINSTLIFCRATADEFNYSSNPNILDLIDPINDKSAADIYLKSYGDYHLLFNYERWDYDDNTGLWRCPPKGDRKIQMRYAQNLTELREYSEEHSKIKNRH